MIRRTVMILPALLFVGLLITVGYAVLGLGGPQAAMRKARLALDREDHTEAIKLLNVALHDLQTSAVELRRQAVRMRAEAYKKVGNKLRALDDLRFLTEDLGDQSRESVAARVRLLTELARDRADPSFLDSASKLAGAWLRNNADDPVFLGQAGMIRHVHAELQVDALLETVLARALPTERQRLRDRIHEAVFGAHDKAREPEKFLQVAAALQRHAPGVLETSETKIRTIRAMALEARRWFVRSLANVHPDLDAYTGLAEQLLAAREHDTVLMLAHAFIARANPRDAVRAAIDIAEIHLGHHRFRAAAEIATRVMPLATWVDRYHAGKLAHREHYLILCYARAARRLGDTTQLEQLLTTYLELLNQKGALDVVDTFPHCTHHLIMGLLLHDPADAAAHLNIFVDQSATVGWRSTEQMLALAFPRLVQNCKERDRPRLFERWMARLPLSVQAVHEYARYEISKGRSVSASSRLERALSSLPEREATLQLLVEAQLGAAKLDLDELVHRTARLRKDCPDEVGGYPALHIAVARRALELGSPQIAIGCAQRARELFPNNQTPIYLLAEAQIAAHRPGEAIQVLRLLLVDRPNDKTALNLMAKACIADGRSTDPLRFQAILNGDPDLESTRFLARRWLQRKHYTRVLTLAQRAAERFGADLEMQVLATRAMLAQPEPNRRDVLAMLRSLHQLSRGAESTSPRDRELIRWALGRYVLFNPENATPLAREGMLSSLLGTVEHATELVELATSLGTANEHGLALRAWLDLLQNPRFEKARSGVHFVAAARQALHLGDALRARELLSAALAFPDGSPAALDLARLDLCDNRTPTLPEGFVANDIASIVVAGTAEPQRAIKLLGERLAADPHNLAAQCALAALQQKPTQCSPAVLELRNKVGRDLLVLTALLESDYFAPVARVRARDMVRRAPENPVAHILLAHAATQVGKLQEAQMELERIREALLANRPVMSYALSFLTASRNPALRNSRVIEQMIAIVVQGGQDVPPALMATVLRNKAELLALPGVRDKLLPLAARFWGNHTDIAGIGLREVGIVARYGDPHTALALLKRIEVRVPEAQREEYLETYYATVARAEPTASAPDKLQVLTEAIGLLRNGEIHGAPLHFVLRSMEQQVARLKGTDQAADAEHRLVVAESQYLTRHLDYFAAGKDTNTDWVVQTLDRLRHRHGLERALGHLDDVLRRDASLLPLWHLRADWLVRLNRIDDGVKSLLWMPKYMDSPAALDTLLQLLARAGTLIEKGGKLISKRGLGTASKLSLGLVQLRLGTYLPAAHSMAQAAPQVDGIHLFFRAQALIACHNAKGTEEAKALLAKLQTDYPKSPYVAAARLVLETLG